MPPDNQRAIALPWECWCQSRTLLTVGQYHRSGVLLSVVAVSAYIADGAPVIVRGALNRVSRAAGNVYFEQIRVLKAGA